MKKSQLKEIIREIINEELTLENSASDDAKRQGLKYMHFGRYGKDGVVTHKSQGGKLVPVKNTKTPKVKTAKKPTEQPTKPSRSFNKEKGMSIYRAVDNSLQNVGLGGRDAFSRGFVPLRTVSAPMTRFSRGDGAKYKGWLSLIPNNDFTKTQAVVKNDPKTVQRTLQHYIESTGAKKIGKVKGEFGSSEYHDVYKLDNTLFVHRGNRVDVGSASRLRNPDVWDFQK
jgi:hypothetical protein